MRRYLVVANRTLGGEHLQEFVRDCLALDSCAFHLLVPATSEPEGWAGTQEDDYRRARERLALALERFHELGARADGQVTDPHPVDAIHDALRRRDYDEVVLSTLPPGASRWLRMDLPSRVRRAVSLPVTHVVAEGARV